jgi:PAS domain S-box-containing protein
MTAGAMGAWEWDIPTGEVRWSPGLERIHGIAPGTFGGTFEEYQRDIHPEDRSHVLDEISRVVEERREHHVEYRIVRPDGAIRWLEAHGRLIFDEAGVPVTLVGVCSDVTERREVALENARLYEAERAARAEAEKASRTREDLLAIVSHDLRNPLGTIVTCASWLEGLGRANELPTKVRSQVEIIRRAARRMDRLIGDLLDLASIDAGRLLIEGQAYDASELVRECVELLGALADRKGVRLEAPPTSDPLAVICDRDRVLQILSNLVGNAIKFTPEGGRISVDLQRIDDEARISVSDTGRGISEEQLPHIFERYWQADRKHRMSVGLGLAIAKGLVEAHRGRLSVTSSVGRGSTFTFTLPLAG